MTRNGPRTANEVIIQSPAFLDAHSPCHHCKGMKRLSITLDEATYERAKERAIEMHISVSCAVGELLREILGKPENGRSGNDLSDLARTCDLPIVPSRLANFTAEDVLRVEDEALAGEYGRMESTNRGTAKLES